MRKFLKRFFIGLGITLGVLLLAAVLVPVLFKKQILEATKKAINENINATVNFSDVDLSLFRNFPNLSVSLHGLTVDGKGTFEGLRLANISRTDLSLDFWSVLNMGSRPIDIRGFSLQKPQIYVRVLPDGQANYDIAIPDSTASESEPGEMRMKLRRYGIYDARITYDDQQGGTFAYLAGFTHTGSGDLTATVYDLDTRTEADTLTVGQGGINYLTRARLDAKVNLHADMAKPRYELRDNTIKINDLELKLDGSVEMPGSDMLLDLKFDLLKTTFGGLLSLVPAAYTADFKDVKTTGNVAFNGFVKGTYNETTMPAFALNLNADNASFQYPTLPMPVKDITLKVSVNSPTSDLDQMVVDISKLHFLLGSNPFDAKLNLRNPMSDPLVDAQVKGIIDLADLAKAFPMEGVNELTGRLDANMSANTRMSYVETEQYEKVKMDGRLIVNNVKYRSEDMPLVLVKTFDVNFTPNHVKLNALEMIAGKSDIRANGELDNLLTYFSRDKVMKGNLTLRSGLIDANEWAGESEPAAAQPASPPAAETTSGDMFDKFDFACDIEVGKILYENYNISGVRAKGSFTPDKAKIDDLAMKIDQSDIGVRGQLNNWWNYVFNNGKLKGSIQLASNKLDLNPFMVATEDTNKPKAKPSNNPGETEPIAVPDNLDLDISTDVGTLIYDTYTLQNVKGQVFVAEQKATLKNLGADIFGGNFLLNGGYDTRDAKKPAFDLALKVNHFRFQDVAKKVISVQKIAPICQYIEGIFNTNFALKGFLNPDLSPDLGSLYADGLLETIDAVIKGLKPLNDIAAKTGLETFKNLQLKNTVNFFTLKDGKLDVKPFTVKIGDMSLNIGGKQGIDTEMDYDIHVNVPRASLTKNPVGSAADQLFGTFRQEAAAKGFNIDQAETVKFDVNLKGTFANPKLAFKFLETGTVKDLRQQAEDKIKEEAEKKRAEIEAAAKAEVQKQEDRARAEADKIKKEAEDRARREADKARLEAERKAKEAADKAKQQAGDKAKEVIKQLPNPFGKGKN